MVATGCPIAITPDPFVYVTPVPPLNIPLTFAESILNSPEETLKPLFAVKCALTSVELGPV